MSYIDVYFSRINHMGENTAERIRNSGIRSFEKWLAQSPHTIRNLSVERGIYFDGIILTSKDKEYEKIMFLEVANDIPLLVGDIINWEIDNGSIEKWLIIQEEKKVNGTFRSFWIVKCNYLMKWINADGHLNQSWGYFVSSLDSKIKGNFRTWHSIITPQPNKYAELLLPRFPIDRATNFIVEDESWTVVEYDHTSVPGVVYLSLTEGKINKIYDDTEDNIADLDKLARYEFNILPLSQVFHINDKINLIYSLLKNGILCDEEYCKNNIDLISNDHTIIDVIDGALTAVGIGTTTITIKLKKYPEIFKEVQITVGDVGQETEFSAYIEGADKIKLARKELYKLITPVDNFSGIEDFFLYTTLLINDTQEEKNMYPSYLFFPHPKIPNKLLAANPVEKETKNIFAEIVGISDNEKIVQANDKNKLGYIILGCSYIYNNTQFSAFKPIEIVPLW